MALPIINLSLIPVFPANVVGDGPIVVTKAGLTYTLGWDITTFGTNPTPAASSLTLVYNPESGSAELINISGAPVDWDSVLNKPAEFPPAAHTHPIDQISGLQAALNDKLDDSQATAAGLSMLGAATAAAQTALLSNFVASGASHAKGLVPDPGASAGTAKFLREDATWASPAAAGARNIVQTIKTDTFTTASTSFVDVTGASVTITPTSATSKVLVRISGVISNSTSSSSAFVKLVRGSTDIAIGDTAGNRIRATSGQRSTAEEADNFGVAYLDSPATTSATTYKLQIAAGGATAVLGRHGTDADTIGYGRYPTILIVEEILQ